MFLLSLSINFDQLAYSRVFRRLKEKKSGNMYYHFGTNLNTYELSFAAISSLMHYNRLFWINYDGKVTIAQNEILFQPQARAKENYLVAAGYPELRQNIL